MEDGHTETVKVVPAYFRDVPWAEEIFINRSKRETGDVSNEC